MKLVAQQKSMGAEPKGNFDDHVWNATSIPTFKFSV